MKPPPPPRWASASEHGPESGIAIGPILYIVAILAVLASAIAAGSGVFSGDNSAISAKAQAAAILEQANEVKFAVDRVLAKGCADTQISFENPIVSGYVNPDAPADKSCHVFDVNGGGIVWKKPSADIYSAVMTGFTNGLWVYHGHLCVGGVGSATRNYSGGGTTCRGDASPTSLVMATHSIKPSVCDALNTMLGVELLSSGHNDSSGVGIAGSQYFKGAYTKDVTGGYNSQATIGKMMGCAQTTSNGGYTYFYAVLIPR
ncbi:MAG: hypothetical protein IPI58_07755 [Alphaproteobacteria bacterium]|nr:MAG: hypothetical protein IPI58_07755 [Alphaproteobacteria bacterium]